MNSTNSTNWPDSSGGNGNGMLPTAGTATSATTSASLCVKRSLRLLLIEDSDSDAQLIIRLLKRAGFDIIFEQIQTSEELITQLDNHKWDIILSDYNMPQFDALAALQILHASGQDIPFIVVSGAIGEHTAVSIMKGGAHDYVMKDNLPRLIPAIERELREAELRRGKTRAEEEQKNLENQLRQAQKMEAVGQLAGGVAHDFNNLLFVITGCTELIKDDIPPDSPIQEDLNMIMAAASKATTLVRQLLLFSRRSAMKPVIIDLNGLVNNLIKMIRRIIGEHISLEVQPGSDLKSICVDPGQMEQVITNLCVNARDAMPEGGKIIIETENIYIDDEFKEYHLWARKGDFVLMTISDTGCGMPHAIQQRIFEPFFTTKEVGKGTGMGLAAVYGIVKSHDGMIHLYSEPGSGTVFKIYIPAVEQTIFTEDNEKVSTDFTGNKETILVAEDEEYVRRMIVNILEHANYKVLYARDGYEAIELFTKHAQNLDLALLDVVMPKLGGDRVMKHIKEVRPDLPIIFLTGYSKG
ncbi:MAG: response regulator, partial [Desulfamplus sp.]|nr:response regulator [Desulfamplus sp.]